MCTDVAVLIPHYNNLEGLRVSLASLLDDYPVEIVIVDDGSKEPPNQQELEKEFPAFGIHVIALPSNQGIEHALNAGLRFIEQEGRFQFVARLDVGDRCVERRIYQQRSFLEKNPTIHLVGSAVSMVDLEGRERFSIFYPTQSAEIRKKMYVNNMFCHPAVMFRLSILKNIGVYTIQYRFAEDYAYFFNIVDVFETSNIDSILLVCQINPKGISMRNRKVQLKSRLQIILEHWQWKLCAMQGLVRNSILYFLPYWLILYIKKEKNIIKY